LKALRDLAGAVRGYFTDRRLAWCIFAAASFISLIYLLRETPVITREQGILPVRAAEKLEKAGDDDEAARVLRAVLDAEPHQPEIWRRYIVLLARNGRKEETRKALAECRASNINISEGFTEP
jgi:uncharacterized protein HemY